MTLQEFYARIGGNYETTIRRLPSEALVRKFVLKYPGDPSFNQLKDALAAQDWETAFRAAHTLKGVAGNLGLLPLSRAVCAIVEPLRAREARDYGALYQAVLDEFRRVDAFRECLRRNYQGE